MSQAPLHIFEVRGDSRQRGFQHGTAMRLPIERAVEFYRSLFKKAAGLDPAAIRARAARFIDPTHRLSPRLVEEYEGLAEGSGQSLEDIFTLSARYEIAYETVALGECSNLYVGPRRSRHARALLGQNWDWRPEVMDFRAVIVARCDDLPDHIVVTECGQPGKYGLNDRGIGVLAAGLCCDANVGQGDNLCVVLSRHLLAQTDFGAARAVLARSRPRATVNFLLADSEGHAIEVEAASRDVRAALLDADQVYWHTNHCRLSDERCTFDDSLVRAERWTELTAEAGPIDVQMVQAWLADRHNGSKAICKVRGESDTGATTWLQTLCSIVMDLGKRTMWVSDGPSCQHPYQEVGFGGKVGRE
jgi:isopenicillin-N N-acyltransferase-like protein